MQVFTWQQMVEQLTAFVRQFGHCHVPTGWPDNPRLAKWVSRQRSNEVLLSVERKEQLIQLGFLWKAEMASAIQARWENHYQQLRAFCLQHGHCRVPGDETEWKSLRSWVDRQRRDWEKLSPDQQQQLLSIGFLPGPSLEAQADQQWERMFARLERYVLVFGHAQVPKAWLADEELAGWVARQRTYPHRLPPERKRRLTRLGFAFKKDLRQAKEAKWQEFYQQLQAFHVQHGHCRVPDQYADNPSLGKWVSWQRKQQAKLSRERRQKLEALHFVFTIERGKELRLQWFRMFGKLKAFHRQYGHARVPENWPEDKQLAIWVGVQRQEGGKLPDWKRKKLDELGFAWREQLKAERRDKWETMYEQLQAFHQQHGHCRVTLTNTTDEKFFRWVGKQRRFPQRLTTEQRYRLNELGFLWPEANRQVKQDKWEASFQQLRDFKRQQGHCQVPEGWPENPKLARWVAFQRKQEERLPDERKNRLDKLGFVWKHQLRQNKQQDWRQLYEQLLAFRERFGHCQVPFTWAENKHLGHWVRRQRIQRETMPVDRREQLEALDFEWQVSRGPVAQNET